MPGNLQMLSKVIVFSAFLLLFSLSSPAQTSLPEFRKILGEQASFKPNDFSALEKGEAVIKLLPVQDKREVAVFGIIRLQNVTEISLPVLRTSITQRDNKSLMDGGKFSNPLVLTDLQSLIFEKKDIEALNKCEVGSCDLKLSAAMINRARTEIDWNSADYRTQAAQLLRQMLFDYLKDYSDRGNEALIQLEDKKKPVPLDEDHRELLEKSLFIKDSAPEFTRYLEKFPRFDLSNVENEFFWSKIKFGLKPIVTLTHTVSYRRQDGNLPQLFVATKQIYASRYVDSSLTFTLLLNIPVNNNEAETYLIFTNRSRSDALDGVFSDFKRNIVEQEGRERARELLEQSKRRMEYASKNQPEPASQTEEKGVLGQIWRQLQNPLIQIVLVFLIVVTAAVLYRKWKK